MRKWTHDLQRSDRARCGTAFRCSNSFLFTIIYPPRPWSQNVQITYAGSKWGPSARETTLIDDKHERDGSDCRRYEWFAQFVVAFAHHFRGKEIVRLYRLRVRKFSTLTPHEKWEKLCLKKNVRLAGTGKIVRKLTIESFSYLMVN